MKKTFKVLATATLAFSMFASVAMADTTTTTTTTDATTTATTTAAVKTSKDFTDLAGLDATMAAKVDALLAKGYMEGKTDTTFDITGNMTRAEAAKLVAKVLGLTVGTETTSTFADVDGTDASIAWSIPFIEAAKKAGIIDGITDTTFAPKDNVTIGQLATMFVKGLGKAADVKTTSPWYQGYMDVAKANGVDLGTDGSVAATRADLVSGSYAADVAFNASKAVTLSGVKASGAKKLEVTFNRAVDTTKAVFAVARGTNAVTTSDITWNTDKTVATINTSAKLFAGDYTVSVTGLSDKALTSTTTATDEKATKITIGSDKAALVDATNMSVKVSYKVLNQYGEDITSITDLQTSSSGGRVDLGSSTATITSTTTAFTLGQTVVLTLVQPDAGISATASLTVSPTAQVANVSVTKLYNAAGSTLSADSDFSSYELVVNAVDQYGNAVTDPRLLEGQVLVSVSNTLVASVDGLSNNKTTAWTTDTIDGANVPVLKLVAGTNVTPSAGTSVVTFISSSTGASTSFTVNVADGVIADSINFGSIDNVVAANDGTLNIPVTITDKNGNEITDLNVLNNATKGVKIGNSATGFTKVDGKVVYQYTVPTTAQTVVLTAITANNKVASKTITVKDAAVPTVITGFTSDVNTNILNKIDTTPGKQTIQPSYLVVQDQYGRTMDSNTFVGTLGATPSGLQPTPYHVVVTEGNTATTSPIALEGASPTGVVTLTSATGTVADAVYKGTESLTVSLEKYDTTAMAFKPVNGSDFTTTLRSVDKSELSSYTVDDIADVYAPTSAISAYQKAITVSGVTADGKKVAIPAGMYTASVSAGSITGGTFKAVSATPVVNPGDIDFTNVGAPTSTSKAITLTVTVNDTGDVITKTFNAVTAAPSVKTLKVLNANGTAVTNLELSRNTIGGTFNLGTIAAQLDALDQYGVEYKLGTGIDANGLITFADHTTTTPSMTISKLVDGNTSNTDVPSIVNNGTSTAAINNVNVGDTFTVTVGTTTVLVSIVQ
ncbi:hypothetical protein A8709_20535 [Paenibacillus pectinilyticus]|uniref:SLH domain-containing protein n=1 Tax=Paenibacillus pectinilyticus TaxID=512399 RepID=A0A1C0ZYF6_9BACL|nr:S-layer homology domain-containing protein [Paenibacillus pectinilyticus]OCT13136.1 hypothetical protein A8709_20535 [Paenibacillus pectinilyticus]